jgi:D-aspartate ligase
MPEASVPAIVLGSHITALAALRDLAALRVPTHLLTASVDDIALRSRWAGSRRARNVSETIEGLVDALRDAPDAVLIPCGDGWVRAAAELVYERNDGRFTASVARPDVLNILLDKGRLADQLSSLGISHPMTMDVREVGDLVDVDDRALARCFLKPRDSFAFRKRFGTKAFVLHGRSDVAHKLDAAAGAGFEMVLQELIPGPPTAHVFLDGFVDAHGRMVAVFARRRLRMWPPRFGNSTDSVTIPLEEARPAMDALVALFDHLGYRGPFDAEFKQDSEDGRFKLIEVNVRAWRQLALASHCGVDVVGMAYADALGLPITPSKGYRVGARWIDPALDVRARLRGRGMRPGVAGEPWLRADHAVFRRNDPSPALGAAWRSLRRSARRGDAA